MRMDDWCVFQYHNNTPFLLLAKGSGIWVELSHRMTGYCEVLLEIESGVTSCDTLRIFPGTFVYLTPNTKDKLNQMYYDGHHIDEMTQYVLTAQETMTLSTVTF